MVDYDANRTAANSSWFNRTQCSISYAPLQTRVVDYDANRTTQNTHPLPMSAGLTTTTPNVPFPQTRVVDYDANRITENTRASYPIEFIGEFACEVVGDFATSYPIEFIGEFARQFVGDF